MRAKAEGRVTNVELFFDLVYVFAVTQLADTLYRHHSLTGVLEATVLLAMVWLVWAYTTWVTNWLDPNRLPVRAMLLAATLVSLVMSAGIPDAFGGRGLWVGGAYAVMQIGQRAFTVFALRGERLQRNFERILIWCVASGAAAVVGGCVHGWARGGWWAAAVSIDLLGGIAGFSTPGLGRSTTADWPIRGNHFAERCQAFMLIALGETIVVIGATLSGLHDATGGQVGAFLIAFVGTVALWWIYFDRSAEDGAKVVASSDDPGRLGRSAYHLVHPIMVAGVILTAASDHAVLAQPRAATGPSTAWMVLGGVALFLAGHAAFKLLVWHVVPWTRLAGVAVAGLLGPAATSMPAWGLALCAAAVTIAVAATDRLLVRVPSPAPA